MSRLLPYAPWLCWIVPVVGGLLTPIFGLVGELRRFRDHLAVASIGLSAVLSLSMMPDAFQGEVNDMCIFPPPIEVGVLVDPLSILMACVVSIIGLAVAAFSVGYMREDPSKTRFWFIMQLFIGGYMLVVMADNFLLMFIGWEIVGLSVTYLTSFVYGKRRKARLGLKVNSILRVGDVALLFFILVVYAYSGTFNYTELSSANNWISELSQSGLLLFSSLMLFIGIIGKAAQFPLHEWLPDMLVGTPSSSNALTECLAGPYLMARVLPIFRGAFVSGYNELSFFFLTVAWVGSITGFVTALTATAQKHPQRVMAYSISSIIGYMLAALGLAGLNESMTSGYLAGTTILTVDAFISALLILSTVYVSYAVGSEDLHKLGGYENRIVHRGMEVAVFAVINLPPFSGFWLSNWVQNLALELPGKAQGTADAAIVYSGYSIFTLLILTGGVSAFYALRVMGLTFSGPHSKRKVRNVPLSMRVSFVALLVVTAILDLSVPLLMPLLNQFYLPIVQEVVFNNVFDVLWYIIPSVSTVLTISALIVGGYVSRMLYIKRRIEPDEITQRYPFLRGIHAALLNRCYINAFYDKVARTAINLSQMLYRNVEMEGIRRPRIRGINEFFDLAVRWMISLSRWVYSSVELGGLEKVNQGIAEKLTNLSQRIYQSVELGGFEEFNKEIAQDATRFSEKLRETQTGVLSHNMLVVFLGMIIVLVLFLMFGGYLGV
ncbi:MAG: proton-conducting transporter membrane subunit [Candidatus Bathyarchaeota archaeon]|nr:proton-conducting transporter membrane subunit [Candidatus Bathyarchaeota archaeon]